MQELELDPTYRIEFGSYIDTTRIVVQLDGTIKNIDKCEIDLGGAVLIRRYGFASSGEIDVDALPRQLSKLICCLDALSRGFVGRSAALLRDAIKIDGQRYASMTAAFAMKIDRFDIDDPDRPRRHEAIEKAIAALKATGI